MIDYFKLGIIAVVTAIVFGSGWWIGYSRYLDYKKEVEIAAKTQEAKVQSIEKQHALVTKGIENEYEAKLALIRQYYANGVRQPNTSKLPDFSPATALIDASTAYSELTRQCAETTQQLISLQDWLKLQMGIK